MMESTDLGAYTNAFMRRMDTGEERAGQAAMNALREVNPDLYYEITDTAIDPFYDDNRLRSFEQLVFGEAS